MSRVEVSRFGCKLRLLRYGLLKEAEEVDDIGLRSREFRSQVDAAKDAEEDLSEAEDEDTATTIMNQREAFVERSIKLARKAHSGSAVPTEAVAQARAAVIREFQTDIVKTRKCANCKG